MGMLLLFCLTACGQSAPKAASTADVPLKELVTSAIGSTDGLVSMPRTDLEDVIGISPDDFKEAVYLQDDGMGGRTIVSGIAQSYEPEELVGLQVCFIANFPPRKLKGVESQGMILSAVNSDGKLVVISPSKKVANGSKVG